MPSLLALPDPTAEQLASPEFEALWQVMRSWDVNVPEFYEGYCGANGSHVALLLNALGGVAPPLSRFVYESHHIAESKGFHEPVDGVYLSAATRLLLGVVEVALRLEAMRKNTSAATFWPEGDLDDEQLHAGLALLLIISEAAETFVSICQRDGKEGEEIADIAIRLFDYCGRRGIDLDAVVRAKMDKNRSRPFKHGCNF